VEAAVLHIITPVRNVGRKLPVIESLRNVLFAKVKLDLRRKDVESVGLSIQMRI
jgi:hypothetical protein